MRAPATPLDHSYHTGRAAASPRALARFAGLLYLGIAIASAVAHGYVPAQVIVPGDAAATAGRIVAAETLFRIGIASEYIILLSEVALCVLLYVLFKPVSPTLALVAAAFRLTMTAIHGANLINHYLVLNLLGGAGGLAGVEPGLLPGLVQTFLDAHSAGFAIGIVFLIPHVFVLGYLIVVSGYVPRPLGALFLLAGCGYLIDSVARLFVPGYTTTPAVLALVIAVAEVAFPLWLLARGVDGER